MTPKLKDIEVLTNNNLGVSYAKLDLYKEAINAFKQVIPTPCIQY